MTKTMISTTNRDHRGNECITQAEAKQRGGLNLVRNDDICIDLVAALTAAGFRAYREDNALYYFYTNATGEQIAMVASELH